MKKKICNVSVTFFLILCMVFGMTVTAFAAEEDAIYTASASINTGAIYTIHSSINRNYVLDVAGASKANGAKIAIKKFVRFETGEGIEKKVEDFAAEVAAQRK